MQKNILYVTNTLLIQAVEKLKEIIMSHFAQSMTTFLLYHLISTDTNWYVPVLPQSMKS